MFVREPWVFVKLQSRTKESVVKFFICNMDFIGTNADDGTYTYSGKHQMPRFGEVGRMTLENTDRIWRAYRLSPRDIGLF